MVWAPVVLLARRSALPWIIGGAFVGAFLFRGVGFVAGVNGKALIFYTPANLDAMSIGCAIALALQSPRGKALLRRAMEPVGAIGIALFVVFAAINLAGEVRSRAIVSLVFGPTSAYLTAAWVVVACEPQARRGSSRRCAFRRSITYGAYAYHQIVMYILWQEQAWLGLSINRYGPAEFVLFFVVTVLIAAVSYRWFERPIRDLARRHKPSISQGQAA